MASSDNILLKRLLSLSMLCFLLGTSVYAQGSVTLSPDTANYYGEYIIDGSIDPVERFFGFVTNDPSLDAGDDLTLTFPGSAVMPSSINPSKVIITGENLLGDINTSTASAISISGQDVIVTLPTGLAGGTDFTVKILSSAKIINPSAGTHSIDYDTPNQGANTTSNFTTVASESELEPASVSVYPSIEEEPAEYTVTFSTGKGGYIEAGETFTVIFPAGTSVPNGSITGTSIKVNDLAASGTATTATNTIVVTAPEDIPNSTTVEIIFNSGLNIQNPTNGTYTLTVESEVETTTVTSENYTITPEDDTSVQRILLSDNVVNANSSYSIDFKLGTTTSLTTSDDIILDFPAETKVGTSINAEQITISGGGFTANPASVSITGNEVTLGVPFAIGSGSEINIEFSEGANLLNPYSTGSYTMDLEFSNDPGQIITSNSYYISTPETSVSQAVVSLDDNGVGVVTDYTINFNLGSHGRLVGGNSTIDVEFPTGTVFGSVDGTLNGTTVNTSDVSANGTVLTITVPASEEVGNGQNVILVLNNIENASAGSYTLPINTSSEPDKSISNQFLIGASSVTFDALSLSNGFVNQAEQYNVTFTVNSAHYNEGTSAFFSAINDYFRVLFPDGTTLPASIDPADIELYDDGSEITPPTIEVNQELRYIDVYVPDEAGTNFGIPQADIAANSEIEIRFLTSAGIINSPVPDTDYSLTIYTTQELQQESTSDFTLSANNTAVTVDGVTAFPNAINSSDVKIEIDVTTGANGRIVGGIEQGSNTILVNFPTPILVPGTMNAADVKLDGTAIEDLTIQSSGAGGVLSFQVPDGMDIDNNTSATILFTADAGLDIDNVSVSNPYTVAISTSAEDNLSNDANLNLASVSNLSITQVIHSPKGTNKEAAYTVDFLTGSSGALSAGDQIWLEFPDNTFIPSQSGDATEPNFSESNVLIDGENPSDMQLGGTGNRTLMLTLSNSLSAITSYSLNISSNAGILNPSTAGTGYTIDMSTYESDGSTLIEGPVTSPTYSVQSSSSSISEVSVSLSDYEFSQTADYTISFRTGSSGRLIAGTSTITFEFPYNVSPASATVNGTAVPGGDLTQPDGSSVQIVVPSSENIVNDEVVTVVLTGIDNPASGGAYSIDAQTSVENTLVESSDYNISSVSTDISFQSIVTTTDTVNQVVGFTIGLTTNENASDLTLEFPLSVEVPASIDNADITINGTSSTNIVTNTGEKRIVITNSELGTSGVMSVNISTSAGLRNPQYPGTFGIVSYTDVETGEINSGDTDVNFTITPSYNSSIEILSITNSPNLINLPQSWDWRLQTGEYGALAPGQGLLKLIFPVNRINVPGSISKSAITINGQVPADAYLSADTLIMRVPSNVAIGNNSLVTVLIDQSLGVYIIEPGFLGKQTAQKAAAGGGNNGTPRVQDSQEYGASTSSEPTADESQTNPLPVELTSFTLNSHEVIKREEVEISWETATEKENYGFRLYRRFTQGPNKMVQPDSTWKKLGFVEGQGFSSELNSYSYIDKELVESGTYEYQLIQLDFDGDSTIYGPLTFDYELPEQTELHENYPNPFNPSTTIPYTITQQQKVTLEVYNILGQKVRTLVNQVQNPGTYSAQFNAASLSSGVYFLRMVTSGEIFTRKILLVK